MPRHKKKKLIYQFLSFILPFIIFSILITSLILSLTNFTFFQKTIHQDYRNILTSSAGEIRLFMDNAQRNLESLSLQMASAKLNFLQKEITLTAFLKSFPQMVSLDLFSVSREKIISVISDDRPLNDNAAGILERAFSGQTSISGIVMTDNEIPHMNIAVPLYHQGKVDEVLWAELNLKAIWDILDKITIGDTGQAYIMEVSGRIIAHREITRVLHMMPAANPDVLKEIRNAQAPVEWTENRKDGRYYNLGIRIPDLDWIVVLNQPVSEVYVYWYQNIFWAGLMTIFIGMAAVLWGWRRVGRFLIPIQTLHHQVQVIGQGNLDQKVSIQSGDEIGDLGMAFNEMTDSLKEYIDREVETAKALAHSQNLALLGTASSKMTHEVGNFLNGIHMVLRGLKKEPLSQKSENTLKIIEKESGQLNEYIHKFLQFAKKPALRLQKIPLNLIIKEILTIIGPEAEKSGISFTFNWDDTIPLVTIDSGLMRQVFNNLIKNSMEAISGTGAISITGNIENDNLVIAVKDSGHGIDAENAEKIFEPFFTTKGSRGTGLGMAIIKANVEAHNGTIECKSRPGEGATFIIRLLII